MTDTPEPAKENSTPSKPILKPSSIPLWLLSSIVIPSLVGVYAGRGLGQSEPPSIVLLVPVLTLFLHAKASANISRHNAGQGALSFIGGWILMVVCYFFGCASSLRL